MTDAELENLLGELRRGQQREAATRSILDVIQSSRDDEGPVFEVILDQAAVLCAASQASLQLVNPERTHFEIACYRGFEETAFRVGGTAPLDSGRPIPEGIRTGRTINIADLSTTEFYLSNDPVIKHVVDVEGVRSWLIIPMMNGSEAVGAIALSRKQVRPFSDTEIALVEIFAAQAAIAIENTRQFKALEALNAELGERVKAQVDELDRMGRLKRFLPSAVADAVVNAGNETMLESHRALVATLFCDLRGFTAFCEAAEPEETIDVLQVYHQEMSTLINQHGGGVDQRAGDGIMVIFNDPIPCDDPAGNAVRLALAMRAKMRVLCANWKKLGHRLGFGVGISFGYATVGIVGSAGRFDYTASGTSINTAARLCDLALDQEILISPRAWAAVEGAVQAESRGEIEMKGIREPVEVFAVVSE